MEKIKIAIAGVGNCASSLIQGFEYYRNKEAKDAIGLMHWEIGGYKPSDIQVVAAFDIDSRKVGLDVADAIFSLPNCTQVFQKDVPSTGAIVQMGCLLDGISEHMSQYKDDQRFLASQTPEPTKAQVVMHLQQTGTEILLNYMPVGSEKAARFYAECALEAGVGFINCMPVFIASDETWAKRFLEKGLPIIGDDVKAQLGATITHRVLAELFRNRGVKLLRTYQINTGGNTDFLNMLNRSRLASKKRSKTEAVLSAYQLGIGEDDIHIGPSDYVPWQKDNKVCFLRMEGALFGDVPMNIELRLSVEDSPNSAGVVIDAIRCCKLALKKGIGGVLHEPSSFFMKHPARQVPDSEAHDNLNKFIESFRYEKA
ncbi:MAG TPA: inositol-3-phosphate synthase [Fibrobacteraceae bacterium]|nr:inositol-3-phosphate synthase [Fibrobacteraceae bacterium]